MNADNLLAAFQTWRDGVRYMHAHFAIEPGTYVGPVPSGKFHDAEIVLLALLPAFIDDYREGSRCSDRVPGEGAA